MQLRPVEDEKYLVAICFSYKQHFALASSDVASEYGATLIIVKGSKQVASRDVASEYGATL